MEYVLLFCVCTQFKQLLYHSNIEGSIKITVSIEIVTTTKTFNIKLLHIKIKQFRDLKPI